MEGTEVKELTAEEIKKKAQRREWARKANLARRAKKLERQQAANVVAPAVVPAIKAKEEDRIIFFTEMDIDRKGRLKASYPFYYNRKRMDEAKEELRRLKASVDRREVPNEYMGEVMERIRSYELQIETMNQHMPKMTKNLDRIKVYRDELEEVIKPTLFTKKEMIDGLVDPNDEARRMSEPIIPVPQRLRQLIVDNGGKISKEGKACRDDIVRTWQLCQHTLREYGGEYTSTDAEYLRQR